MRDGARSADDVGESCGAGTACGGCLPAVEAIVRAECAADCADATPLLFRLVVRDEAA